MERAASVAADALRIAPSDPRAGEQLASVFADSGNAQQLGPLAEALVARFPDRDKPRYYRANALFLTGRTQEAINEAQSIVGSNPKDVQAQNLLGVACATSGRRDCALAAFNAALNADARDPTTYVNLGVFHLQAGDAAAAVDNFSVALTLDRSSSAAAQGLSEARERLAEK
jgi:Flp pilus assembly protein TadD